MAYLETLHPRDWGFCTLFGYPYLEGVRNLRASFSCWEGETLREPPSLLGRITHFALGTILLIPLLNTIVFIVLRLFCAELVLFDHNTSIAAPPVPNERVEQITQLNMQRNRLYQELMLSQENSPHRNEWLKQIKAVELEAARTMQRKMTSEVSRHMRMSLTKAPELIKVDGTISHSLKKTSRITLHPEGLPETEFTQVGGLSQYEGYNYMCGYYALFFMLQAATGKEFTDRDAFHPFFTNCLKLIATKRAASILYTHPDEDIPYGLNVSVKGPDFGDFQYLIDNCEALAPLRSTTNCFLLEMDEYHERKSYSEPIKLLGKSGTEKKHPEDFPLYFLFKEHDHYYFVYSKKPGQFTFVHSLNYSVLNPSCLSRETLADIIRALTGTRTPLRIKW